MSGLTRKVKLNTVMENRDPRDMEGYFKIVRAFTKKVAKTMSVTMDDKWVDLIAMTMYTRDLAAMVPLGTKEYYKIFTTVYELYSLNSYDKAFAVSDNAHKAVLKYMKEADKKAADLLAKM